MNNLAHSNVLIQAIYGSQDEEFDRAHGLHSLATLLGRERVFKVVPFLHAFSIICFVLVGFMYTLRPIYYVGILLAAGVLFYQYSIVSVHDYSRLNGAYFLRNGLVSIAIFIFTLLSL